MGKGPALDFFKAIQKEFPDSKIIAEDLGEEMDQVFTFRKKLGLPGMAILQFAFGGEDDNKVAEGKRMYNSPQHKVEVDEEGNLVREYDKSTKRTSLVDNEVRVYKGGSWRDRDYWLDPAQRRYFPQDMATDYIGFRCAMSRLGSKSKKGKRPRNN